MKQKIHNLNLQMTLRRNLRQKQTKAELLLWQKIRDRQLGRKFRRQHSVGPYVVDFYCSEIKVVVEIDGNQYITLAEYAFVVGKDKPEIEIEVKYSGFMQRQLSEVKSFKHLEKIKIPQSLDYNNVGALSREIKEKLMRIKPLNLGQASRISGVTPAAITILMVYLRKMRNG